MEFQTPSLDPPSKRKTLPELPLELMAEILCRLPVKILLQIRCLSKLWRRFIDSPFFINTHLSRSIQTRNNHFFILTHRLTDDVKSVDLEFLQSEVDLYNPLNLDPQSQEYRRRRPAVIWKCVSPFWNLPEYLQVIVLRWGLLGWKILEWKPTHIFGICNGLVLMSGWDLTCLWNPSTRKHLILPKLELPSSYHECQVDCYGFGYDSTSGSYKVIWILMCKDRKHNHIQYPVWVYSLQSNSWTEVTKSFPPNIKCEREPGVLVSEALHWPVKVKSELDSEKHDMILAFDLKTEEYQMFLQPKCQNPQFYSRLGTLNGSLCLIYSYLPVGFEIWVMGDYGADESWTRMALQEEYFISYPGGFTKATLGDGKDAPLYIKTPCHFGIHATTHADICVASLVSLDGGDQ